MLLYVRLALPLVILAGSVAANSVVSRSASGPIRFEPNVGQTAENVRYVARGNNYSMLLSDREAVMAVGDATLRMELLQGSARASHPEDRLGSVTNYYIGSDPAKWRPGVPNYERVRFEQVYPGIDLVYYGTDGRLEYDFIVSPGADPSRIRLKFSGSRSLRIDAAGDLIIGAGSESVRFKRPLAYQTVAGRRVKVNAGYLLSRGEVTLALGNFDRTRQLVIDPVILYSTYVGGTGEDVANRMVRDSSSNTYITGYTSGAYRLLNAYQGTHGGGTSDVFLTKINSFGSLVYSTYLGGTTPDVGFGVAVDSGGSAYVTGLTSGGFPLLNATQSTPGGGSDAFIARFNSSGFLNFSTYLGGAGNDIGYGIAVDGSGNMVVAGSAGSTFPTLSAVQAGPMGAGDAFVSRMNSAGVLTWSTLLGGSAADYAAAVATDSAGVVYVTGRTGSANFPLVSPAQSSFGGGTNDAFVARFLTSGALSYSTYAGGPGEDTGDAIAVDGASAAYVAGSSTGGFPVLSASQGTYGGGGDAILLKYGVNGTRAYATYFGGTGNDAALAITVDSSLRPYIAGRTTGALPVFSATQAAYGGGISDAFAAQFNSAGGPTFATYLGGAGNDTATGIQADATNIFVSGHTTGSFPTVSATQSTYGGGVSDVFWTKISFSPPTLTNAYPNSIVAGSGNTQIHLAGSNISSPVVVWNGTVITPSSSYSSGLIVTVPASLLTTAGTVPVIVRNADGQESAPYTFPITGTPVTASITSGGPSYWYYPDNGTIARYSMNVSGTGIQPGAVIRWNGVVLQNTEFSYSNVNADIPESLISIPGPVTVTVTNPGAGPSAPLTFTNPPRRRITSISPSAVATGSGQITLTINGENFVSGDRVSKYPNYQTFTATFVNSNRLTATIPSTALSTPGTLRIQIENYLNVGNINATFISNQAPLSVSAGGTCTYSVSPSTVNVSATATAGSTSLTAPEGCGYSLLSTTPWISFTNFNGGGSGSRTLSFQVTTNTGPARSGTLNLVNGAGVVVATVVVSQAAASCSAVTLSPASATFNSTGTPVGLPSRITLSNSCSWTASTTSNWITLPASSGTGDTVSYNVAPNPNSFSRTGSIVINGRTVTISQLGVSCSFSVATSSTDPGASRGMPSAAGSASFLVNAPGGCGWNAISNAAWITVTSATGSGNGTVSFNVAANGGASARTGSITVGGQTYVITQVAGAQSYTCSVTAGVPPLVRGEGIAERLGDVVVSCVGQTTSAGATADVLLSLNTTVTGRTLSSDSSGLTTDVLLLVDEPAAGAQVLGTNTFRGTLAGPNQLRFSNVPLAPAVAGNFSRVLRITNVRADVTQIQATPLLPGMISGYIAVIAPVPVTVQNSTPVLAFVQTGATFSVLTAVAGPNAGQTIRPLRYSEGFASALLPRLGTNQDPSSPGFIYNSESGYLNSAVLGDETGFATTGTRLTARVSGVPAGVTLYAPIYPTVGTKAQLVSADANGAGGLPVLGDSTFGGVAYQTVLVDGKGNATLTWECFTADPFTLETLTFNLLIGNPGNVGLTGLTIAGGLGPQVVVSTPSRTAPVPRFLNSNQGIPLAAKLSVVPRTSGSGLNFRSSVPKLNGITAVGTVQVTEVLTNDGTQAVPNVVVGGTLPTTATIIGCTSDIGGSCQFQGNRASIAFDRLEPNQTATITMTAYLTALPPTGFVPFSSGVSSDLPNFNFATGSFTANYGVSTTPVLAVNKTHTGDFRKGQTGKYTITVTNTGGASTQGTVTVTDTLPAGMTLAGMSGSAWICTANTCNRSDELDPGSSYPPITVNVNVSANAATGVLVNSVSASGGGSSTATATDPTNVLPGSIVYNDLSGTGRSDVFLYDPVSGNAYAGLSAGNGSFTYPFTPFTPGFDVLRIGEFNSDGKGDMVVYNSQTALAYLGIGNGNGTFNFQSLFWSPGFDRVETGDLNNDVRTDFVLYRSSDGTMYTALSNGAGGFTYKYTLVSVGFTHVKVADFNADGRADVFFYRTSTGLAYLGLSAGDGTFTFSPVSIDASFDAVEQGDINGDGRTDLLFYFSGNGVMKIGLSNGNGFTFTRYDISRDYTALRLADFNRDGKADLILYNRLTAYGVLGFGTGTGTFNYGSIFWGPGMDNVDPQDLNGDGFMDVVIYNSATGTAYSGLGAGNGAFSYYYSYWGPGKKLAR